MFEPDRVTNMLIQDCGGHGRAMKVLSVLLRGVDVHHCDFGELIRGFREVLYSLYGKLFPSQQDAVIIQSLKPP